MTEDEAKTKWRPFARVDTGGGNANNRWARSGGTAAAAAGQAPMLCIGSACMAWRWQMTGSHRAKIEAIREHRAKHNSSLQEANEAVERGWTDRPTEGFCGLAGQPA